jgi:carboxylate-amine ligase
MALTTHPVLDAAALRAVFAEGRPPTVGLEEELMLLDPETLDLLPRADAVLARVGDPGTFRRELPAAQVELAAPPLPTVPDAAAALLAVRRDAAQAASGIGLLAGAGAHPFASGLGELNGGDRYLALREEFAQVARRQLCFGLHVHVAVPGPDRALAALEAVRRRLPELAALAANAPFYEGHDTGLASVRPKICDLLPRQGIPPHVPSFEAFADALRWGAASGRVPDAGQWWWEARLHVRHGTVEVRCPDTQATVADAAAVAAVVQCLVVDAGERWAAGEPVPAPAQDWRLAENRWSACRHGVGGTLADPGTGESRPTREVLFELLDGLAPTSADLGCTAELGRARQLAVSGRADVLREAAGDGPGAPGRATRWLAERFLSEAPG